MVMLISSLVAGLLKGPDLDKYNELKRSGGHLEERATDGLLPITLPITLPGLDLPLGGGLREFFLQ